MTKEDRQRSVVPKKTSRLASFFMAPVRHQVPGLVGGRRALTMRRLSLLLTGALVEAAPSVKPPPGAAGGALKLKEDLLCSRW